MNTDLNLSFLFTISRKVVRHLQICHVPLFYAPFAEPLVDIPGFCHLTTMSPQGMQVQ